MPHCCCCYREKCTTWVARNMPKTDLATRVIAFVCCPGCCRAKLLRCVYALRVQMHRTIIRLFLYKIIYASYQYARAYIEFLRKTGSRCSRRSLKSRLVLAQQITKSPRSSSRDDFLVFLLLLSVDLYLGATSFFSLLSGKCQMDCMAIFRNQTKERIQFGDTQNYFATQTQPPPSRPNNNHIELT